MTPSLDGFLPISSQVRKEGRSWVTQYLIPPGILLLPNDERQDRYTNTETDDTDPEGTKVRSGNNETITTNNIDIEREPCEFSKDSSSRLLPSRMLLGSESSKLLNEFASIQNLGGHDDNVEWERISFR